MRQRRPTLADRIMTVAGRWHAQRVYRKFLAATRDAPAVQRQVLLSKIRRNAGSRFGRDYGFDQIRSPEDFVRRVPILRYEDHRPYIERVMAGDLGAMFGGRQRVHMFAMTSGTTAEPKYIPVTSHFLREYRRGWNAFGVKALLDHPQAFLRCILQVSSRMDESHTSAGIPCGAITGLMAATQKRLVRKYYITPRITAHIEDATARYYTIMRLAVPADVAFPITASPATQLKLVRTADEHREQLIRDVHDGTLWEQLPVPGHVREALRLRLVPDPEEARRLEGLVKEHGRLLPKHYWNLAFIANWTGGTMGLYLREFPQYFGDVPVRDVGLLASEGRVSMPIEDGTAAGILDVSSHFIEFVPVDRMEEASPQALRCHQLEVGQEYFVLLTTSSGLCRYDLGDVVRVVGYEGQAPVIEFLNKGAHTSSLAGEKLTEHQVILAMEQAARRLGLDITNFVLAPQWANIPFYRLHMEAPPDQRHVGISDFRFRISDSEGGADSESAIGNRQSEITEELDRQLQAVNLEYASKRKTDRLGPVCLNRLPDGFLARLDTRAAERRKGNEQFKHRYLYCRPGDDAGFPLSLETRA
jgi:hypothetical protein